MFKPFRTVSNSKDLKLLNRIAVLNAIRKNGPVARHEVAKITGLTPPTVTVIVADLIAVDLVREVGRGESNGGRRPVMLELNPAAGCILAVRIQHGGLVAALLDLSSNILASQECKLDTTRPETVIGAICAAYEFVLGRAGVRRERVYWCGVASPGLVNSYQGVIERSSNLKWQRVNLGEMLSKALSGMPVHVENISNAAALGEKTYGNSQGCANLIYVNLSVGIGAGIIVGHELFGGVRGYAGEIGEVEASSAELTWSSGGSAVRYRTFEEICGTRAVLERVKGVLGDRVLAELGIDREELDYERILAPPFADMPEVRRVLHETGCLVGVKVADLINLFNTERIVLGGELTRIGDLLLAAVTETVRANTLNEMSRDVAIAISSMEVDPSLLGIYALVLEKLFHSEVWFPAETN